MVRAGFERLYALLTGAFDKKERIRRKVIADRKAARAKLEDAERRGDTRDMGRALMELRAATHQALRHGA